jgi:PAS domain S-box-containing protein
VPSVWDEYKWHIIVLVSLTLVQSGLITGLLLNRSRRKRAEVERERFASLAESERRHLDEVVSNVPGIAWESLIQPGSRRRKVEFVSQYVEKMLGYSVEEWVSTPELERSIIHEEDREEVARVTSAILESGKEDVTQFRCVAKDGRELWAEAHLASIRDETGKIIGLRGVTIDITDRRLAEQALIENEAKLAGIVGSAMDAIISIDERQRIVLFNAAAQKMFRCAEHEVLGQPIDRFIPVSLRESHRGHVRTFGETSVTTRSTQLMGSLGAIHGLRADGEEFPIEASISQLELHGQKFYTVILRDITERHRAMEALRESEERFRNMADKAPVMIWVSGMDKLCTYFNQQWLDFTGRTLEAELGNGWTDGLHRDDYHRCLETYTTAFDLRQPFTMEYRLRRADGQFRWILDSGTPRFSPGEKFLGYIGSCIDITERKAAEEALEDLSGQLIRARENECARIARELHDDLNQRMALISIELEQLGQSTLDTDGKLRRHLQGIVKQAAEVSREIHRISYDLHPSKLVQLGLVAAVKSLCDELRSNHELEIEFFDEGVPVGLPQDISLCLYRIVQESLNNVIRHSGAEEAEVELLGTRDEVRLRVSDSGIGFDIESPGLKKGLGMLGMRERLRLVGGSISIDSKPSKGTELNVRVPLGRIGHDYEDHSPDEKSRAVRI